MEAVVKKLQVKFKKVRELLDEWDALQSRLISQFKNASHIIDRLQVLQNSKNYGDLNCIGGIREAVLAKQVQSLDNIFASMRRTLEEFHCIVLSLEKMHRDGRQLVKGGSSHSAVKHLQQRVGVKPTLADCLDGLLFLHEIHHSDSSDLGAVQQLLVDQPNIPSEEVQFVFDIIFAEELCS